MSEIKVNKLSPRSGTAVTLGDSGDTFTIPSGATLAIAGSVTGFTSAGIDDNATSVAITISSDEDVTFTEDILLGDNKKALFGAGSDLQIYHDGSHSFIADEGTGNLTIKSNGAGIELQKGDSEFLARFKTDDAVELYHNNSKKFETASDGIFVNGVANVDVGGEPPSTGMLKLQANSSQRQLRFSPPSNNSNGYIDYRGGNLLFKDDGTEVARFQGSAGFGIGTGTVDTKLNVTGTNRLLSPIRVEGGSSNGASIFSNKQSASEDRFTLGLSYSSSSLVIGNRVKPSTTSESNATGFLSSSASDVGKNAIKMNSNGNIEFLNASSSSNAVDSVVAMNERMRITNGGSLLIGTTTVGSAGAGDLSVNGGVFLGGTGTANKLDDYEEGTWTPSLDSVNSSNASGQYTKIGNVCTAKFKISSDGSGSNINITGFPFTSGSGFEQQGLSRETQTSGELYFIRISGGNTVGTIIRYDASNSITSNDTFEGQITYITNT